MGTILGLYVNENYTLVLLLLLWQHITYHDINAILRSMSSRFVVAHTMAEKRAQIFPDQEIATRIANPKLFSR